MVPMKKVRIKGFLNTKKPGGVTRPVFCFLWEN